MLKLILIVLAVLCFLASAFQITLRFGSAQNAKTVQTTPLGYALLTTALLLIV